MTRARPATRERRKAEWATHLVEERRAIAAAVARARSRRAERAAAGKAPTLGQIAEGSGPPADTNPIDVVTIEEQEARFAAALDPGRAVARDLLAGETARIEAALSTLPPDARAWVAAGCTLAERSRRLGEALTALDDDDGHFFRIISRAADNPVGGDEKHAPTRRTKKDRKP